MPLIFSMINKNKTAFRPSLVPKGRSSIIKNNFKSSVLFLLFFPSLKVFVCIIAC